MVIKTDTGLRIFIEGLFFRSLRKALSSFYHSFKKRPGSYPYLTGDSFRALADHIYDETGTCDSTRIQNGDVVFVGNNYIDEFFVKIHPQIKHKYILIQHNGDNPVNEHIAKYIDEKIVRFYAQCVFVAHEKIVPIPIGIANKHHGIELYPELTKSEFPKVAEKKPRIFFHFSIQTNPSERGPALEYFRKHAAMDTIQNFIPYKSYKKLLGSYCFTASPAGNALGSHRTWEALYLHTIPLVKRTVDAESCVALGMPIWIVDDWHELDSLSEPELRSRYEKMMATAQFEALYMDYWIKRIKADQNVTRNI